MARGVLEELLCARCGHPADIHSLDGFGGTCMHRRDLDCDCPVTWEAIERRAIRRLTADLAVKTESDPEAESRARQASEHLEIDSP